MRWRSPDSAALSSAASASAIAPTGSPARHRAAGDQVERSCVRPGPSVVGGRLVGRDGFVHPAEQRQIGPSYELHLCGPVSPEGVGRDRGPLSRRAPDESPRICWVNACPRSIGARASSMPAAAASVARWRKARSVPRSSVRRATAAAARPTEISERTSPDASNTALIARYPGNISGSSRSGVVPNDRLIQDASAILDLIEHSFFAFSMVLRANLEIPIIIAIVYILVTALRRQGVQRLMGVVKSGYGLLADRLYTLPPICQNDSSGRPDGFAHAGRSFPLFFLPFCPPSTPRSPIVRLPCRSRWSYCCSGCSSIPGAMKHMQHAKTMPRRVCLAGVQYSSLASDTGAILRQLATRYWKALALLNPRR